MLVKWGLAAHNTGQVLRCKKLGSGIPAVFFCQVQTTWVVHMHHDQRHVSPWARVAPSVPPLGDVSEIYNTDSYITFEWPHRAGYHREGAGNGQTLRVGGKTSRSCRPSLVMACMYGKSQLCKFCFLCRTRDSSLSVALSALLSVLLSVDQLTDLRS